MSQRRTLILIGALVLGVVAAGLIFQYVGGVEDKAAGSAQTVQVLVAIGPITKGAEATGLVDMAARRVADKPQDAITHAEDIKSQIAAINIAPGTVITSSMFVNPNQLKDSNAEVLEPGMTAITMSFDPIKAVAGLVKPGDYVNMIATNGKCVNGAMTSTGQAAAADPAGAAPAAAGVDCAGHVYQKIKILAIGRSFGSAVVADPAAAGGAPTTTAAPVSSDQLTFAVPPEAAQMLSTFSAGSITLTLVRDDYVPHPIPMTLQPLDLPGVAGQTPVGGDPELKKSGGQ